MRTTLLRCWLPAAAPIHRITWLPPLHIDVGAGKELVHDERGRRPAVVHVADEVELVDDEVLDERAQGLQRAGPSPEATRLSMIVSR